MKRKQILTALLTVAFLAMALIPVAAGADAVSADNPANSPARKPLLPTPVPNLKQPPGATKPLLPTRKPDLKQPPAADKPLLPTPTPQLKQPGNPTDKPLLPTPKPQLKQPTPVPTKASTGT